MQSQTFWREMKRSEEKLFMQWLRHCKSWLLPTGWLQFDVYECFFNNKLVETSEIQNHTQRNFALKLN